MTTPPFLDQATLSVKPTSGLLNSKVNPSNMYVLNWWTWSGGRIIDNPYSFVFGYVIDMVLERRCKRVCFLVDFGCYFGVQEIPIDVCYPWSLPSTSLAQVAAIGSVISSAKVVPCQMDDI